MEQNRQKRRASSKERVLKIRSKKRKKTYELTEVGLKSSFKQIEKDPPNPMDELSSLREKIEKIHRKYRKIGNSDG